ncbi:flagellar basal body P-ring protein FlgI, partial [Escherichia coli]|nr:flagellar basal body P-ring protein FlgI [Escherichia coli]
IAAAVNAKFAGAATATDGGAVKVVVPAEYKDRVVELVSEREDLEVTPVRRARVVINERTGTIVAGGEVRLSPSAVVHGGLTVVVKETPTVSQP